MEPIIRTVECVGECDRRVPEGRLDWSFLGPIYCISLKDTTNRTYRAQKELCRAGMCGYAKFYQPDRDTSTHISKPGLRGCWESHRAISFMKGNPCVFEDDVLFVKDIKKRYNIIRRAVLSVQARKWNIICLGCFPFGTHKTKIKNVRKLSYFQATHAYIMGDELKNWLQKHKYNEQKRDRSFVAKVSRYVGIYDLNVDVLGIDAYITHFPDMYMIYPTIAYQAGHHDPETKVTTNNKNTGFMNDFVQKTICPETQVYLEKTTRIDTGRHVTCLVLIGVMMYIIYRKRRQNESVIW